MNESRFHILGSLMAVRNRIGEGRPPHTIHHLIYILYQPFRLMNSYKFLLISRSDSISRPAYDGWGEVFVIRFSQRDIFCIIQPATQRHKREEKRLQCYVGNFPSSLSSFFCRLALRETGIKANAKAGFVLTLNLSPAIFRAKLTRSEKGEELRSRRAQHIKDQHSDSCPRVNAAVMDLTLTCVAIS